MRIRFLGTGASGGTPGRGRSSRRESSALVDAGPRILIDVTRDFPEQCQDVEALDAVLLTHAHRDACGGIAALSRWWRGREPLPVYASAETLTALRTRVRTLDGCALIPVRERRPRRLGPLSFTALVVPHAREPWYPTYAWKLRAGGTTVVYASDLARLEPRLRRFSRGAGLLVIDGAMWRRRLFSHLTIDAALPELCDWPVDRIVLTQIGRTAPVHEELAKRVAALCARAAPAYDGLEISV